MPKWGMREVQSITHDEAQVWVSALAESKSASVVLRAEGILRALLAKAKADKCIHDNPCEDLELPRKRRKKHVYLTIDQLLALADASDWRRPIVLTLGLCGLRWGELVGLQVGDVDFKRQRIHVRRSATEVNHEIVVDAPKTGEEHTVIFPRLLRPCLEDACNGRSSPTCFFPTGAPARICARRTGPAVRRAGFTGQRGAVSVTRSRTR